jgi:hypothetical protein
MSVFVLINFLKAHCRLNAVLESVLGIFLLKSLNPIRVTFGAMKIAPFLYKIHAQTAFSTIFGVNINQVSLS